MDQSWLRSSCRRRPTRIRGEVWWLVMAAGALALAGCDQLASLTGKPASKKPPISTAATAAASDPVAADVPTKPMVPATERVADVNGRPISIRDVELVVQDLKEIAKARGVEWSPLSAEEVPDKLDLHDILNDLVLAELKVQDAVSFGRGRDVTVQRRFWQMYRNFFAQEWLRYQVEQTTLTEKEISEFYNNNQAGFREPERIRVRRLVLVSEDRAKAALVKLLENMDFEAVAQQMSLRPEAAANPPADQWLMRTAEKAAFAPNDDKVQALVDPALEKTAFAVDREGGVSTYVKGADGNFYIFQVIERKAGRPRSLVEVSDTIRNYLQFQRLTQKSEELRKKGKVEVFDDRLKDVQQ